MIPVEDHSNELDYADREIRKLEAKIEWLQAELEVTQWALERACKAAYLRNARETADAEGGE